MNRKVSRPKSSFVSLKLEPHGKRKTAKNSSARTPKHLESILDHRSIHLSKFKTAHAKPERDGIRSIMPPSNLFSDIDPDHLRRGYKTNQTEIDFPQCHSEKTITLARADLKQKDSNKSQKTSKKPQGKKKAKQEFGMFESCRQFLTTRKGSVKKASLKGILQRTEKVLEKYQKREEEWMKERQTLMGQVEQMRQADHRGHRESSKKCITHSSSACIRRTLY